MYRLDLQKATFTFLRIEEGRGLSSRSRQLIGGLRWNRGTGTSGLLGINFFFFFKSVVFYYSILLKMHFLIIFENIFSFSPVRRENVNIGQWWNKNLISRCNWKGVLNDTFVKLDKEFKLYIFVWRWFDQYAF